MKKRILLLGCTGSIGASTLAVAARYPERCEIVGVSAHSNAAALLAVRDRWPAALTALSGSQGRETQIRDAVTFTGTDGLLEMIRTADADLVVNGIAGAPGLAPSLAAVESGKHLILANKETAVMAGRLIFDLAARKGVDLLPVDSELSAILQLIRHRPAATVASLILTASGGPFRTLPAEKLAEVTVEQALRHPTWSMGSKISIDSATLANKGLEVIETHMFFQTPPERIQVLVHPQSIIHSMITTTDGCIYAQLSAPDMKIPIANALFYPEIAEEQIVPFDPAGAVLSFEQPDLVRFPMLAYAYETVRRGGAYMIAYNAANETAVEEFVRSRISFTGIAELTDRVLQSDWSHTPESCDEVFAADAAARSCSRELLEKV